MTMHWNPNYLASQMTASPVVPMGQVFVEVSQAKAEVEMGRRRRHRLSRRRRR